MSGARENPKQGHEIRTKTNKTIIRILQFFIKIPVFKSQDFNPSVRLQPKFTEKVKSCAASTIVDTTQGHL